MKPPNFAPISFAFSAAFSAAAFVSSFALDPNMIVQRARAHGRVCVGEELSEGPRDATIHIHI